MGTFSCPAVIAWLGLSGWLALVKFYDRRWNSPHMYRQSSSEAKCYYIGEPSILDMTSRDDILKALEDGRMDKIADEYTIARKLITTKRVSGG